MKTISPYVRKPHFYETDQMGIVHHANYIHWFEEARVDFMDQMGFGYKETTESGVDIAVISVNCEYKRTVKYGETVEITCTIKELKSATMTVEYVIKNTDTGEICTTGESRHCFMDKDHGLVRLNRALPELYGLFKEQTQNV